MVYEKPPAYAGARTVNIVLLFAHGAGTLSKVFFWNERRRPKEAVLVLLVIQHMLQDCLISVQISVELS
jgi:hypothetical protein